jgi:hypothetical protein
MANATLRYQTITTLTTNKQMSNYILNPGHPDSDKKSAFICVYQRSPLNQGSKIGDLSFSVRNELSDSEALLQAVRCLGMLGCDSEARPRNRCLGMLGVRYFIISKATREILK